MFINEQKEHETTEGELQFSTPQEAYDFRSMVNKALSEGIKIIEWKGLRIHTGFARHICDYLVCSNLLLPEKELNNPINN